MWLNRFCLSPKRTRIKSFELEKKYSLAVEYAGISKILLWKASLKNFCCPLILKMMVKL